LVFIFVLICVQILSYLFIKVYFCLWSLLVFIKRGVLKIFKWCWKREKALCKKLVQEGACVDCGLGFFMLDSYKVANSLYYHLIFDFLCHLMLLLMSLCRFAWLWPLLLS
jgi:hypothetical protein